MATSRFFHYNRILNNIGNVESGIMKSQIKRTIAILLAVCFVVSLTATAVCAAKCTGPIPKCPFGTRPVCDSEGVWICEEYCSGFHKCLPGQTGSCVNGVWKCQGTPLIPCSQPKPYCGDPKWNDAECRNGYWYCYPL